MRRKTRGQSGAGRGGETKKSKSAQVKTLLRDQTLKIPSPVLRERAAVDRAVTDKSDGDAVFYQ